MGQRVHVKVCGVTTVDDALACVAAGADAIGLNFVPASPRFLADLDLARRIVAALPPSIVSVAVVADPSEAAVEALLAATGVGCIQFHGDEPPELVARFLPHAYKALRIADAADVARADLYPGSFVLVDARVEGRLGGTGQRVDPSLVEPLARRRKLTLAGGLTAENVGRAIALVRPYAVDVASGVEPAGDRRRKDLAAVRAFVDEVRRAGER
jgi:phosphoribosylanthranilate isomerase